MFNSRLTVLLSILILLSSVTLANAGLSDPMRPPGGYTLPVPVVNLQAEKPTKWILQSVLLGENRAVAVINGVSVSPGEKIRGAKLIKIRSDEVVLQAQGGKKITLKLTPNIRMNMVSADTEISLK